MLATGGCVEDPVSPVLEPCRCAVAPGCLPNACSFQLSLHSSCGDEVTFAEVLVDGHLEEGTLEASEAFVPCTRTDPGASSTVIVRGGGWIWGPLIKNCGSSGGEVHTLVFECAEAAAP
jgi:hypothetical protein